jgi:hypothetical protein
LKVFLDEILRLSFAAAATSADRQAALHFEQGARAVIHSFADFPVGYSVANANVHVGTEARSVYAGAPSYLRIRMIVNYTYLTE